MWSLPICATPAAKSCIVPRSGGIGQHSGQDCLAFSSPLCHEIARRWAAKQVAHRGKYAVVRLNHDQSMIGSRRARASPGKHPVARQQLQAAGDTAGRPAPNSLRRRQLGLLNILTCSEHKSLQFRGFTFRGIPVESRPSWSRCRDVSKSHDSELCKAYADDFSLHARRKPSLPLGQRSRATPNSK